MGMRGHLEGVHRIVATETDPSNLPDDPFAFQQRHIYRTQYGLFADARNMRTGYIYFFQSKSFIDNFYDLALYRVFYFWNFRLLEVFLIIKFSKTVLNYF